MKAGRFGYSVIGVLTMMSIAPSPAFAQHDHGSASQYQTADQNKKEAALVQVVREATERYRDVRVAEREGFALNFGCVSGSEFGAMGLHYVNMARVADGVLDPTRPEIILYEPTATGRVRITGADFLVLADQWNAQHPEGPPQLMGQLFHFFDSPNRFGLPPFYTLHVWAWKDSPTGSFVNWHPNVSCDGFKDQN
jgi:hypothetical protein